MTSNTHRGNPSGWDHLFQSGSFPPRYKTTAAPNQSVVDWAGTLPAGAFILDLGCGVGRHVVYLGQQGFRMAGADISPSGVKQTQEVCAEQQIVFDGRVAEMTNLPWSDTTFDAVLSTSTVCHLRVADIAVTVAEIHRVLKPGGFLLVDFLHKGTLSYQETRKQAAEGKFSEIEANTFVDDSATPDLMDDAFLPHHYCDEAEVNDLLQDFEMINVWADLSDQPELGQLPRRGYWVASARKPSSG